jgi:outer membrane lipoprotein carrier protein
LIRSLAARSHALARLLTVSILSGLAFSQTAKTADTLIQKVQQRYNGAQTLSVNFVENFTILGHPRAPESGTLTLRKQGKMRWDYSQPKGKLFISDGKNVFLYTAADNRVEKIPLKNTEDMRAPLAFLLGRLDMKKEFRDFHVRDEQGAVWLDATAKTDRLPYSTVDMQIGQDGNIQQLKVMGRDESVTEFRFSDERLNPPVPPGLFHFEPPPGAEVVDSIDAASSQ